MKIVLITGSPRKKGTSNLLAEHFIKGAEEAGHRKSFGFRLLWTGGHRKNRLSQPSLSVRQKFSVKGAIQ